MAKKRKSSTREKPNKKSDDGLPTLVPSDHIESSIVILCGEKVLLDADLAEMYGVETRTLVQAVKRNAERFPEDFMFQLDTDEFEALNEHFGDAGRWGGRRYAPFAFTEQGVAMLSGILNSKRAVQVNIEIMRAFVRFRRMLSTHEELARKLDALERKYDEQFKVVFDAIRQLMIPPASNKAGRIGFRAPKKQS